MKSEGKPFQICLKNNFVRLLFMIIFPCLKPLIKPLVFHSLLCVNRPLVFRTVLWWLTVINIICHGLCVCLERRSEGAR